MRTQPPVGGVREVPKGIAGYAGMIRSGLPDGTPAGAAEVAGKETLLEVTAITGAIFDALNFPSINSSTLRHPNGVRAEIPFCPRSAA